MKTVIVFAVYPGNKLVIYHCSTFMCNSVILCHRIVKWSVVIVDLVSEKSATIRIFYLQVYPRCFPSFFHDRRGAFHWRYFLVVMINTSFGEIEGSVDASLSKRSPSVGDNDAIPIWVFLLSPSESFIAQTSPPVTHADHALRIESNQQTRQRRYYGEAGK